MTIHHIGYAVKDIDTASDQLKNLGFETLGDKTIDEERDVVILFVRNDQWLVELIAPLSDASPVSNHLSKTGPSPYHICFEVDDIDAQTGSLGKIGFKVLQRPSKAPAIAGRRVTFLFHKDIGLIELVESSK